MIKSNDLATILRKYRISVTDVEKYNKFTPYNTTNYYYDISRDMTIHTVQSEKWKLEMDLDDLKNILSTLQQLENEQEIIDRNYTVKKAYEQYKIALALVKDYNYYDKT